MNIWDIGMVGWFTNLWLVNSTGGIIWRGWKKEIGEHVADQPPVIAFPEIVGDISLQNGDYVYNMHVK